MFAGMSRIGAGLCAMYALAIAACFAVAFLPAVDSKGRFVFMQLPLALQAGLLQSLGFGPLLARWSWITAYLVIGLPTFGLLYFVGWLIDGGSQRSRRKDIGSPGR